MVTPVARMSQRGKKQSFPWNTTATEMAQKRSTRASLHTGQLDALPTTSASSAPVEHRERRPPWFMTNTEVAPPQTQTSLRALQPRPSERMQQDGASPAASAALTASVPSAPSSGRELMVLDLQNKSQDGGHDPDGESATSQALPQERASLTQQKLQDRANNGDLQARLELVSSNDVEAELARMRRRDQPNRSILDFLRQPGDGVTPAQAAAQVLNELADETEETAQKTVFVWRYIQLNEIWQTHENPKIRSLKAFLDNLDQDDIVMANAVIGTTTQNNKRQSLLAIHRAWGPDWVDSIPKDILPANVTAPIHLSKRLLFQIATTCKKDISLEDAVQQWKESVKARLDRQVRKTSSDSRTSQKSYILPDDISRLYQLPTLHNQAAQKTLEKSIREIKQDRIQLKAPPRLFTLAPKPDAKRQRGPGTTELQDDHPPKRLSGDGTKQLVKVRNHLIVQPVPKESVAGASQPTSQADSLPPSAQRDLNRSIFVGDTDSDEDLVEDIGDVSDAENSGGGHSQSCEGSLILQRLGDQVQWSQDGRDCCKACRTAIASVQYAISRATAKIVLAHR